MSQPTAIILAGGKSSRMGQDKGIMLFNGKSMIQHVIDAVLPLTNRIIIISNNEDYQQFGFPVFPDTYPDKGPLGGIITGLSHSQSELNWILSCDTPNLTTSLLRELMNNTEDESVQLTSAYDKIHPLIGTYHQSALNPLKEQLALSNLKLLVALKAVDLKYFDAGHFEEGTFNNINTPEDL